MLHLLKVGIVRKSKKKKKKKFEQKSQKEKQQTSVPQNSKEGEYQEDWDNQCAKYC